MDRAIRITAGTVSAEARLNDSKTARAIWDTLPIAARGETWGEDTSANMHHSFADLIAYASQAQMLYPGELLGSGTAAGGSGLELDRWLQAGDEIELEIEGIGILRNRVGTKGA